MKHPLQSTAVDSKGVLRFVRNEIVSLMVDLLNIKGVNLNELHRLGHRFDEEDWDQFNQLIGYSVCGAPISEELVGLALDQQETGKPILEVRAERAEAKIQQLRVSLCEGVADLYGRHPSDLIEG